MPRRILYYLNIVKAECRDFSKNKVFQHLTLPRRILYYPNTAKAAGRDFSKTHVLIFDSVEAQHIHFSNIENTLRKAKPPYRRTDIYTESIPPFGHIARLAGYKKDARKGVLLFSRRTGRG